MYPSFLKLADMSSLDIHLSLVLQMHFSPSYIPHMLADIFRGVARFNHRRCPPFDVNRAAFFSSFFFAASSSRGTSSVGTYSGTSTA